jgi:hypothetical protein
MQEFYRKQFNFKEKNVGNKKNPSVPKGDLTFPVD